MSKKSMDPASYSLTDTTVIDALNAAARGGVVIRIVLDPQEQRNFVKFADEADNARDQARRPIHPP